MKTLFEFLQNIKFDTTSIGIQKDLLLASLIGVISNLPKGVKSKLEQATHIIVGTLLSTILTPFIIAIIEHMLSTTLPPASGYGIAALIGIVGLGSIKKYILNKIFKQDQDDEPK